MSSSKRSASGSSGAGSGAATAAKPRISELRTTGRDSAAAVKRMQELEAVHTRMTVVGLAAIGATVAFLIHWGSSTGALMATTGTITLCSLVVLCTSCCWVGRRHAIFNVKREPDCSEYTELGLGTTVGMTPADLYLDMVKRAVINVLYQDIPLWYYDADKRPVIAPCFNLSRRMWGEDAPLLAHSMTGWKRLTNIQDLVKLVVAHKIPGDIVETGVLRGGALIFAKACLRALNAEAGRNVVACDTFCPQPTTPKGAAGIGLPLIRCMASVISKAPYSVQRSFFMFIQNVLVKNNPLSSFPYVENPSFDTVYVAMFLLRFLGEMEGGGGTTLEDVKDTFARYGLLDDNVKFLKGYFSDTLPKADISQVAILRLDGDTYESTITALEPMYPKLSVGGYVIVDDYHSFVECRQAIDEYRQKHNITDALVPVDNLSVYWQKTKPLA